MTFALIPAAGTSSRMGRPKLALPLGDGTVLGHVVEALRQAELEHILVVVGPHVPELVALAEAAGATALLLAEQTADMRATIEQGLTWLETRFHPGDEESWLLAPADHPTLDASIVTALAAARTHHAAATLLVPTYQGRRGHPLLLRWSHVPAIRALPSHEGLNVYVRGQTDNIREVELQTAEVLRDLDTPEDYARLVAEWPLKPISSRLTNF